ncbi:sensor histidine kinase [Oerskovia sp. NPDC057915]|uniref:sensor histidine kinase n=1 Tax=Oerskovia sp. NPDC057915 TaxID=3346280 RepID=UPI0036D823E4
MPTPRAVAPPTPASTVPSVLTETQALHVGPIGHLVAARPWVADLALALGVLLLGLVTTEMARMTVHGSTGLGLFLPGASAARLVSAVWWAGSVLGAVLLVVRRASPLVVTGALTVLALGSLATAGVLGVLGACLACALCTVAATRPPRTTWITCATVFLVVTVALWHWQDIGLAELLLWSDPALASIDEPGRRLPAPPFSAGRRTFSVLLLLGLLLLGVATGAVARARRQHAHDLVERYAAMARERDQSAALARAAERARIAREMHDVVAHNVSVMVALSDGAGAALDRAPERSREALRELSRTGRGALSDMQGVLGALDPGESADAAGGGAEPVATDLATIVGRFRSAGVPVGVRGLDIELPQDTTLRLAVARVVTEALTNVLRHAPGTPRAEVAVRRGPRGLEVEVLDDGGTRPGSGGGSGRGILGMRERAALLGGHVEVGPRPGGGWRVHLVLPSDDRRPAPAPAAAPDQGTGPGGTDRSDGRQR